MSGFCLEGRVHMQAIMNILSVLRSKNRTNHVEAEWIVSLNQNPVFCRHETIKEGEQWIINALGLHDVPLIDFLGSAFLAVFKDKKRKYSISSGVLRGDVVLGDDRSMRVRTVDFGKGILYVTKTGVRGVFEYHIPENVSPYSKERLDGTDIAWGEVIKGLGAAFFLLDDNGRDYFMNMINSRMKDKWVYNITAHKFDMRHVVVSEDKGVIIEGITEAHRFESYNKPPLEVHLAHLDGIYLSFSVSDSNFVSLFWIMSPYNDADLFYNPKSNHAIVVRTNQHKLAEIQSIEQLVAFKPKLYISEAEAEVSNGKVKLVLGNKAIIKLYKQRSVTGFFNFYLAVYFDKNVGVDFASEGSFGIASFTPHVAKSLLKKFRKEKLL